MFDGSSLQYLLSFLFVCTPDDDDGPWNRPLTHSLHFIRTAVYKPNIAFSSSACSFHICFVLFFFFFRFYSQSKVPRLALSYAPMARFCESTSSPFYLI
jgi:hypothetical protein